MVGLQKAKKNTLEIDAYFRICSAISKRNQTRYSIMESLSISILELLVANLNRKEQPLEEYGSFLN